MMGKTYLYRCGVWGYWRHGGIGSRIPVLGVLEACEYWIHGDIVGWKGVLEVEVFI